MLYHSPSRFLRALVSCTRQTYFHPRFALFPSLSSTLYSACINSSVRFQHGSPSTKEPAERAKRDPTASALASQQNRSAWPVSSDFPYPVKRMQLRALRQLYMKFFRIYDLQVPASGIDLDVGYIDTGCPAEQARDSSDRRPRSPDRKEADCPTVLVLHGAGGTHLEMGGIIQALARDGARVLCPNFPGYGPTPMDADMAYSHTIIENCNFLLDFLVKLRVVSLDLVVAFSAGGYPAVPLAMKSNYPVRGVALIQLPGHRVGKVMRPFWLKKALIKAMKRKWVRSLLTPINQLVMRNDGWKAIQSIEHTYIMGLTGIGVPFDSYENVSLELLFNRVPLLLTFSEDDKFIDKEIGYEYASLVGLPKDHLTIFNRAGEMIQPGQPRVDEERYLKGLVFQKGGHFAQTRQPYAGIIEEAVVELYRHVCRKKERDNKIV